MYLLNMSRPDMRSLKKSLPEIANKKMLARGNFSTVYPRDEHSIWKLTCDSANYSFAMRMKDSGNPHYQIILEDKGQVGELYGQPIYLFAVERLEEVEKCHPVVSTIIKEFTSRFENLGMFRQVRTRRSENASVAYGLSLSPLLSESLREAFTQLRAFILATDYSLDIAQRANFMIRPSDGSVILTDPLFHEDFCDAFVEGQLDEFGDDSDYL